MYFNVSDLNIMLFFYIKLLETRCVSLLILLSVHLVNKNTHTHVQVSHIVCVRERKYHSLHSDYWISIATLKVKIASFGVEKK